VKRSTALVSAAALAPFAPAAWQMAATGLPDILLSGDGAALELRVLHAARSVQLLGPYSQYGWSHPGPAYFYLALPFYEWFGERATALNVFALAVNAASATAIALNVKRVFEITAAVGAAALLGIYLLLGLPSLPANEWNPILPILPFVLVTLLATRFALGENGVLPAAVFVASAIVQTHVAYAPAIAAMTVIAALARRQRVPAMPRRTVAFAAGVLVLCWALPAYEAATARPGNVWRLIAFFAPGNLSEQSWGTSFRAVRDQMAVMPLALSALTGARTGSPAIALALFALQVAGVGAVLAAGARHSDRRVTIFAVMCAAQLVTALIALRAIRGEVAFYLVAWVSAVGVLCWLLFVSWATTHLHSRATRAAFLAAALAAIAVAFVVPVARPGAFPRADPVTDAVARKVDAFVRSRRLERVVVRIVTPATWPHAAGVVLRLYKYRLPVAVEDSWLFVMGPQFEAPAGAHASLLFGDRRLHDEAKGAPGRLLIAEDEDVYVYFEAGLSRVARARRARE
jgi:hypothetical protein